VYRRLKPVHTIYTNMGIYQRDVTTYRESPILLSGPKTRRCVNCHTFANNEPDMMNLHVRGPGGASMILAGDGKAEKINTVAAPNSRPASYTAWHPNGRVAAFAAINVIQFHHATGNSRGVLDLSSDVRLYRRDSNTVTSNSEIAHERRLETFPTWSPDGKYLYFCSAEKTWGDQAGVPTQFKKMKYDLMRVSYDAATERCGRRECVLSSAETGLSINEPRISPDGRFLLFCMAEHGSFPVFMTSSDLYMMEIATRRYWPLSVNSDKSDSWHCWSKNGRWIAFASKRRDGLLGRVYFSYIDQQGKARKPILLPQRDPAFYDSFIENFNAPELITSPVRIDPNLLAEAITSPDSKQAKFAVMPEVPGQEAIDDKTPTTQPRRAITSDLKKARSHSLAARKMVAARDIAGAIDQYKLSIASLTDSHAAAVPALSELAWIYATYPDAKFRDGPEAIRLASKAIRLARLQVKTTSSRRARQYAKAAIPKLHDTLGAAHAESGRFMDAANISIRAEKLALDEGQFDLAKTIRSRSELYLAEKPYRSVR
jgi:dipeptidyl aminopeptidase/acylaminoacyl peptidase